MRSSLVILAVCVGAVAVASISAQENPMRPGRWQVTMQMQMPNMPMQMPAMTTTQCVTAQELEKDPGSGLPRGTQNEARNACKVSDHKVSGDTVTWKMTCSGAQVMSAEGELTFVQDSYTGTMKMTTPQGPMSMKLAGKRLGDCTD